MGLLDAPAKGFRAATLNYFAAVRNKLDRGGENVVIGIGGDSTGAGTGLPSPPAAAYSEARWPWLLAAKLAAAYPAYTVNFRGWNVTGNVYDATIVVQTGTGTGNAGGPFVIDIYNSSASGQNPSYTQSNCTTMFPVAVDLFIFSHSHNMGTTYDTASALSLYYPMVRDCLRYNNPNAAVVVVSQNPQVPGATAGSAAHLLRSTRLAEMCASEGWGFINVMQAFLDVPNWATALVNPDGIHPSTAGSVLWVNTVWRVWTEAGNYGVPRSTPVVADRLTIPGHSLLPSLIVGGAPLVEAVNSFLPAMTYSKQASPIGASTIIEVPLAWRAVNLWVWWTTTDGAAGNVAWRADITVLNRANLDISSAVNSTAIATATGGVVAGAAPSVALAESHTRLFINNNLGLTGVVPRGTRRSVLRLTRDCTNGADTYAGSARVYAVILERAY